MTELTQLALKLDALISEHQRRHEQVIKELHWLHSQMDNLRRGLHHLLLEHDHE